LVIETGCAPDKLVEDAMAGYVAELVETREMLNSRYDDLKSGKVTPISRDEVLAHFREKSAIPDRLPELTARQLSNLTINCSSGFFPHW
jgi:hypothetical protein